MHILYETIPGKKGDIGLITLNRQKALNALNHEMFLSLDKHLKQWQSSENIKAVVIRAAEGRAFCAGGDIREAYEFKKQNSPNLINFFGDEYRLNLDIFNYRKPYIALLDGITMGGGAGISIHGSHRVGTERLVFAMPETSIGFYPDVGMTYWLARMQHKIGYYLGLVGAKISFEDCFALGLTTHTVKQDDLQKIIQALSEMTIQSKQDVDNVLQTFTNISKPASLLQHHSKIEKHFAKNSVEEIIDSLARESDNWCQDVASQLRLKSPMSLKVTLHAIQQAEKLEFNKLMQIDFRLTNHFLQGHDFFEGIRALLIDKDQKPEWRPAKLEEITAQQVQDYFAPLEKELVY
jgi:enoyl-CoA hydratase/carnithine racemase